MNIMAKKLSSLIVVFVVLFSITGCSNMSKRDRNTAIGAGAGAVGGADRKSVV